VVLHRPVELAAFAGHAQVQRFHMPGKDQKGANYFAAGTAPTEMKRDPTAYIRTAPEVSVPNLRSQENKMKFHVMASAVVLFLVSTAAFAQDSKTTPGASNSQGEQVSQANPFSTFNKFAYARLKTLLVSSAEKMPEENYNFKPTEAVRSYGQIVGHVADAQYNFCSLALGENNPGLKIEQTKTTKADLVAALKNAVAYCDKAYDGMTDASGAQMVKLFGTDIPKLGVLNINNMHDMEHYGNFVTYMRIKNIVPPSSEQAPAAQPKK
jgi:uncharacterized damage-inducible protein DinB